MARHESPADVDPQPAAALHLSLLYEQTGLPRFGLQPALADLYGGDLGFDRSCVYANFVSSLDGVVALGPEHPSSGSAISGHEPADRFVMGLLRACAEVVLLGAGTLRATPEHRWTPEHAWPPAGPSFAALRRHLGHAARPELAVVTARGEVPADHPGLEGGALVLTTAHGARRLAGRLPDGCTVIPLGEGPVLAISDVLAAVRAAGHRLVLTEGGPRLLAQLVGERLLDELFVTVSPVLAGRAATHRPGLVTGLELLPSRWEPAALLSARRRGAYLFLRYRLSGNGRGSSTAR